MWEPGRTGGAVDKFGNVMKGNKGIWTNAVFTKPEVSNIETVNMKVFSDEFIDLIKNEHYFFEYLYNTNAKSTLISYYENEDYYSKHRDHGLITILSWLYKEPKSFTGGDLTIEEELTIECKHNRLVIFPSILYHSVNEVSLPEELSGQNLGRYTIAQFVSFNKPG
jgi:Rps23 Pro-64 3,4-dihydroxylase Tpa1-like proline 4-hydroxylase